MPLGLVCGENSSRQWETWLDRHVQMWQCSRCRRRETQSHAPNQPNQIHTTPDTEPRRSRTKKNQGRPPVSGSTGNRYFFNLLQSNFPASHLALNRLNQNSITKTLILDS